MHIGTIIRIIVVAGIFLAFEKLGIANTLGAHPFWAPKVTYIGIALGIAITILTLIVSNRIGRNSMWVPAGFFVITIVVAAVTLLYGKAEFAASYAENAFAGRVWYIGFMALIAGAFVTVAALWQTLTELRNRTASTISKS